MCDKEIQGSGGNLFLLLLFLLASIARVLFNCINLNSHNAAMIILD